MGQMKPPPATGGGVGASGMARQLRRQVPIDSRDLAVDGQDALEQMLVQLAQAVSLDALVPEIRSAICKARQHDQALALNQALSAVVDQGGMPFLLLTEAERVCFASPAAHTLIAGVSNLTLQDDRLVLSPAELDQALRHAIVCGRTDLYRGIEAPENIVRVPRAQGQAHLQLLVRPLAATDLALQADSSYTSIFLHDPDAEFEIDSFQLAALFDLSYAEARVTALLATGKSLAAIAEHLHLSIHTVRTELKAVFRKTATGSQAELVKLVLTSPAYRYGKVMLF